jgi:regulator of sigma E protease
MSSALISILAFVVAISVLVAVHEFGHFWVARRLGFKVLRFSIGFGPPLLKRVAGPDRTEYVIAAVPLGGYVKMLDEREGPVPEAELPRSFTRRPVWQRLLTLAAGPAFNFLFAILVYWIVFMWGVPQVRPVIGQVTAGSHAAQAGLKSGDEIVKIEGVPTPSTKAVIFALLENMLDKGHADLAVKPADAAGHSGNSGQVMGRDIDDTVRTLRLSVDNAAERHQLTEPGALLTGLGFDFRPIPSVAVIGRLVPGGAAASAGLAAGDRVFSVDGVTPPTAKEFIDYVRAHPDQGIVLGVDRGGSRRSITVEVHRVEVNHESIGRIGADIYAEPTAPLQRLGVLTALGQAGDETWEMSKLTVTMLWNMVAGKVSVKNISGPINIAAFAGESARVGLRPFLSFLAIVSISLGVLNLLPIPILDGGQMLYQLIELVKGSPLSERAQLLGQRLGIALLLILMSLAFYNDISSRFFN